MKKQEQGRDMPVVLPEFCGYTVDERLREFRIVDRRRMRVEFIPFDSPTGQALLRRMNEEQR